MHDKYIEIYNTKGYYRGINNDIAEALNISSTSVSDMIKRVRERGWILPQKAINPIIYEEIPKENEFFAKKTLLAPVPT